MAISNTKKIISDFDDKISVNSAIDIDLPEDLLDVKDLNLITNILNIANKYQSDSWIEDYSITEMTMDLINLQSFQVDAMYRFGILNSTTDRMEERLKLERSKIRMKIKSLKKEFEDQGSPVSITADDAKDLSYAKTEQLWIELNRYKSLADFLKSIYFSVKDLVFMLNSTIQRLSRIEIQ